MLTTKYVRDNLEQIRDSLERRKSDYPLEQLLDLDKQWREMATKLQQLQASRNRASIEVSELKKKGAETESKISSLSELKQQIADIEGEMPSYEHRINQLLWNMPNVLDRNVPYGKDDTDNVELKKVGAIPSIKTSMGHEEALVKLGLIDLEQAASVAGARFFYLKGDIALLEQALIQFSISELVRKGYALVAPPLMMKRSYYRGVTALADFEEMLYRAAESKEAESKRALEHMDDELFMIGTSEHPIAAMHANHIFKASELPKRYVGFSPCFRREAGAHGKDTKGIFRVHQFYKVEQFVFSTQNSWPVFEELLANSEELFQKLGLPYRVLNICTGDIGTVAARKLDIEAYLPAQGSYREMVSCSNCTEWQSVRLDIKYEEKAERRYVHTLNSTAVATTRAIVAIVENYLNSDGTITVPDVLIPYMGKSRIGSR